MGSSSKLETGNKSSTLMASEGRAAASRIDSEEQLSMAASMVAPTNAFTMRAGVVMSGGGSTAIGRASITGAN